MKRPPTPADAPTVRQIYGGCGRMWWRRYREALPCSQRVVPLSRSNGTMILSVCWKIKVVSSLSLNSWEKQHVQRIDKRREAESHRAVVSSSAFCLSVCLENLFHERIFNMASSSAMSGTRRGCYCRLLCIQQWNTNSCDMDLCRIVQATGRKILTVAFFLASHQETSIAPLSQGR